MKNKILVCVHVYYHNQVDYIIEKLKSLNGLDYDLFVTYTNENKETNEKFLNFNKNVKFKQVENKGYDIYPFLVLINEIDLEKYSSLLKLHTKNCSTARNIIWRNDLYENLLGTKYIFRKNLKKLKKYGVACSKKWIYEMEDYWPEDTWLFEDVCTKIGIEPKKANFIAGTIFLARIEIIKRIKELNLLQLDFENKKMETGSNSTDAHVVERLFSVICNQMGYEIYGSNKRKLFSQNWNKEVLEKCFSIKNKYTFKYIKFLGFSIKLNRYNYLINGRRNRIFITSGDTRLFLKKRQIKGLDVSIKGNDNSINIAKTAKFINCNLIISSHNNNVVIKDNVKLENCTFVIDKNNDQTLTISENAILNGKKINLVNIGQECVI